MTKVIRGSRRSGKTALLIEHSCTWRIPIVVANPARALNLEKQARDMGYTNLPKPLLAISCVHGHSLVGRDKVLIDDVDDVIRAILGHVDIHMVTYTKTPNEYDLDEIRAKNKEYLEEYNSYLFHSFGKENKE